MAVAAAAAAAAFFLVVARHDTIPIFFISASYYYCSLFFVSLSLQHSPLLLLSYLKNIVLEVGRWRGFLNKKVDIKIMTLSLLPDVFSKLLIGLHDGNGSCVFYYDTI